MRSYTLVHPNDDEHLATMPSPSSSEGRNYEDEKIVASNRASAVQVAVKSSDVPPLDEGKSTYGDTMVPAAGDELRDSFSVIGLCERRRGRPDGRRSLKKRRKMDRAVDEQEQQRQQKEQEHEQGVVVQVPSSLSPTENERQAAEALLLFSEGIIIFPTPVAAVVETIEWCHEMPKDDHLRVQEATKVGNQEARLTYTCKYCGKVFDNRHALGGHVSGHKHRQRRRHVGRIKRKLAPTSASTVEGGVDDVKTEASKVYSCGELFSKKERATDRVVMAEAVAAAAVMGVVAVAQETLRSWGRTRHRCQQRRRYTNGPRLDDIATVIDY